MKLAELGLKTKPETKYFALGFISFKTVKNELLYQVNLFDDNKNPFVFADFQEVEDKAHLDQIMSIKHRTEVTAQ